MSRHRAEEDVRTPWQEGTKESLVTAGLDPSWVRDVVLRALTEDLGPDRRDVTTLATIPADQESVAQVVARADGVVAGLVVIPVVLAETAAWLGMPVASTELRAAEGQEVRRGDVVAELSGPTRVLLVAERTMLNLCSHTSGIATHTRAWVEALAGSGATVLDTRKTTPGLRALDKYGVRAGGGDNKRMGLYDVAMIKDNHKLAAGSLAQAHQSVRGAFPEIAVQVEVTTVAEAEESVQAGARFLLCDNMSLGELGETVRRMRVLSGEIGEPIELEATGGLTLELAAEYAATGVDYLSVGALTHSSPALDLAMDLATVPGR